jgi:hypothetical protein
LTEIKLNFKPTASENIFISEPYKVVHYDWVNNGTIERSNWRAYHRIMCPVSHKWLFGNAVEYKSQYESVEYPTKEAAISACQKHFESEEGKALIKEHNKYFKG